MNIAASAAAPAQRRYLWMLAAALVALVAHVDAPAQPRTAYGALIAARYTEFLEGAVIDGNVIQPLRLIAPDNTVQVALYTMEKQKDGRWKISGCVLAPSTVQAA
jgi:hypothetical protein